MSRHKSLGLDICIMTPRNAVAPRCPHGPTVLFERYTSSGRSPERFYACSASRDRKFCGFYQRLGEIVTPEKEKLRENYSQKTQPKLSHGQYLKRAKDFTAMDPDSRKICIDCGLLLLHGEDTKHVKHRLKEGVNEDLLTAPTKLLIPLENKKTNAQYLFAEKTVQFIVKTAVSLRYKKMLCLGTPRIHEEVCKHQEDGMKSLLLDIDHRFEQFYSPECFLHYNMFNNHLFDGEKAKQRLWKFLLEDSGPVLVLVDPPFGGLAELLAHTIKQLSQQWREVNSIEDDKVLPLFWFFPYYLEGKVTESLTGITMLDYKVEYENHAAFKESSKSGKSKLGSAVRIFTNLDPVEVVLPKQDGYRLCKRCKRYVSAENVHCAKCDACTSKDGRTYKHCDKCQHCVKPSKVHCDKCGVCDIPGRHSCDTVKPSVCHICAATDHKRKNCPLRKEPNQTLSSSTSLEMDVNKKIKQKSKKKRKSLQQHEETNGPVSISKKRKTAANALSGSLSEEQCITNQSRAKSQTKSKKNFKQHKRNMNVKKHVI